EPLAMRRNRADLLLVNGRVYGRPGRLSGTAVAMLDGRIVAVGSDDECAGLRRPATPVLDLEQKVVLPGLIDCHTHVASDAKDAASVELRDFYADTGSVAVILERLRAAAD